MKNFIRQKKSKLTIALIIGFILAVITSQVSGFAANAGAICDNTLRLHILANSNSQNDQQLKLAVRDFLLGCDLFEGGQTKSAAEATLRGKLPQIEQLAQAEVLRLGYSYKVRAEIANMYFDQKSYGSYTLPSGYYDALRITIGEAKGRNWWCVLYPSLCVPAATKRQTDELANLTPEQQDIIKNSGNYELRFASVDWFHKLMKLMQSH